MAVLTAQDDVAAAADDLRMKTNDGWLGILSVFAVVWGLLNLLGLTLAITQTADTLARSFSAEQVAYIVDTPVWARMCHAVSVVCLLVGAGYLLMRRRTAYHWFMVSLFAMLGLLLDGTLRGGFELLVSISTGLNLGYMIVGVFLFWAAYSAQRDGQLG